MHKKILLKLSGEFLKGDSDAVDITKVEKLADQIDEFVKKDIKVAIVIGAGNIMRGRNIDSDKYSTIFPDYAGMLGSVINSLMLNMVLQQKGIDSSIESPFDIKPVVNIYKPSDARQRFEAGSVVIFGGGTGKPGFSTDTAAVLFGSELGVDAVYKGTLVDGVYSDDPNKNPEAIKFDNLTYKEAIEQKLKIMDITAFEMAKQNKLPVLVFKWDDETRKQILAGEKVGTTISG